MSLLILVLDSAHAGTQTVGFMLIGYRSQTVEVNVPAGQTDTICAMPQERRVPLHGQSRLPSGHPGGYRKQHRVPRGVHTAANRVISRSAALRAACRAGRERCRL